MSLEVLTKLTVNQTAKVSAGRCTYDYNSYMSLNEDIPVAVSLSDVGSALVTVKASSLSSVLTGMKVYYQ